MSRSTADWLLRLDAEAWVLSGPAGRLEQVHGGVPAAALGELQAQLPVARRGARLRVVLGDAWLRYLVLTWPPGVRRGGERRAYLIHRFREVHQVAAPDWVLSVDRDVVNFPALACAVPAALLAAVQDFAGAARLRLAGVSGDFVDCFNRAQGRFDEAPGSPAALALRRGQRLTVGLWRDGAWRAVRSRVAGEAAAAAELGYLLGDDGAAPARGSEAGVLYTVGAVDAAPPGWRRVALEAAA